MSDAILVLALLPVSVFGCTCAVVLATRWFPLKITVVHHHGGEE